MLALIVVIAHFAVMKRECLHSSLVSFILFYFVITKQQRTRLSELEHLQADVILDLYFVS